MAEVGVRSPTIICLIVNEHIQIAPTSSGDTLVISWSEGAR